MPLTSLEYCEDGEEGDDEREDGVGNEVAQGVVVVGHAEGSLDSQDEGYDLGWHSGAEVAG